MARYTCSSCGEVLNTTTEGFHLCKAFKKRYERSLKNVEIVVEILKRMDQDLHDHNFEDVAAEIVKALSNRHLEQVDGQ